MTDPECLAPLAGMVRVGTLELPLLVYEAIKAEADARNVAVLDFVADLCSLFALGQGGPEVAGAPEEPRDREACADPCV